MTVNVRPLTGQVLLEMLPPKDEINGVFLPSKYRSKPTRGRILKLGPWPALRNGMRLLPEVKVGDIVWIPNMVGQKLTRDVSEKYKLVRSRDVLCVEIDS
jgi:chaperonin GroES